MKNRNIDEIQKQNQKLIRYAREITEHRELEEKAELELKTKEYNEKLDMALKQMEEFKAQREKQEHIFDEICKQRDTYKQLLNQLEAKQQESEEKEHEKCLEMKVVEREKNSDETLSAFKKLQSRFEKYQNKMMGTNRVLNGDIESLTNH